MSSLRSLTYLAGLLCLSLSSAAPAPQASASAAASSSGSFWIGQVDHSLDSVWTNGNKNLDNSQYPVFRNVMDYGAKGDGSTDDTDAINKAMTVGNRCGGSAGACDSSTVTPALVYFPPGTYIISSPINMYYYTQMIGDAVNIPTIKASPSLTGMAMIDADPYDYAAGGVNWYTNQNNFFRQIRNFVLDVSPSGGGSNGSCIHWQVAQATSLQNIVFQMSHDPDTTQQGIFMDNGSGGFFSDLTFNGGKYGAFLGSQQFTSRNLTFNNCQTAILMNWNWGWVLHGITVNGGTTALDMSANPTNQSVGSVVLADSTFKGMEYGVRFAYKNSASNVPATGGTLVIDNVDMSGVTTAAVVDVDNSTVVAPGKINAWASGHGYTAAAKGTHSVIAPTLVEKTITGAHKASSLLDSNGNIFARSKPQYDNYTTSDIMTAKSNGCKGDGNTDDTAALQKLLNTASQSGKLAYLEHGAYLVTDTINVPNNAKITGEVWSLIVAQGSSFNDANNPKPVFQVGSPTDKSTDGAVEMSDLIFETKNAAVGAIMIEWNLNSPQGASGIWDCHVRIGGSANTGLEGAQGLGGCRNDTAPFTGAGTCEGVFLMFHATKPSSNVYLENTWFWVADHDLDNDQPKQISIYSARGALFQSQGPVHLWGTASEHSAFYNYQFDGVQALFSGFTQSETPYYQPNPETPTPFHFDEQYDDPLFTICNGTTSSNAPAPCRDSWGLRVYNSNNVLVYGTGMYSFFENYGQACVGEQNCQLNMIHIQSSQIDMYSVTTKAAVNMLVDDDMGTILDKDNRGPYPAAIAYYMTNH